MVISMLKLHSKFEFCNDPSKLQCLLFKIWFINKVGIYIKVRSMISIRNQMCNQLGKKNCCLYLKSDKTQAQIFIHDKID